MSAQNAGSLKVTTTGSTTRITTSASAKIFVPKNGAGGNPRYVRILVEQSGAQAYITFGSVGSSSAALTASLNGLLVNGTNPQVVDVKGLTLIKAVTRIGTAHLNLAPVDE